jgi:hypothetical protein
VIAACVPNQAEPLLRADHRGGAHAEPVWALRWLDKGPEFEELLVSVSADGRVSQWSTGQVGEGGIDTELEVKDGIKGMVIYGKCDCPCSQSTTQSCL